LPTTPEDQAKAKDLNSKTRFSKKRRLFRVTALSNTPLWDGSDYDYDYDDDDDDDYDYDYDRTLCAPRAGRMPAPQLAAGGR
jgi:hypothetical protein